MHIVKKSVSKAVLMAVLFVTAQLTTIAQRVEKIIGGPFVVNVTPTGGQTGNFVFACANAACGSGHSSMVASIQVSP